MNTIISENGFEINGEWFDVPADDVTVDNYEDDDYCSDPNSMAYYA